MAALSARTVKLGLRGDGRTEILGWIAGRRAAILRPTARSARAALASVRRRVQGSMIGVFPPCASAERRLPQIREVAIAPALFKMNAIPVQRSATREGREHLAMREQEPRPARG